MERNILLFWRQARGGVLMFTTGPALVKGEILKLAFGTPATFAYEIAEVYKPAEPAALIEQYYNVWEPVLDPAQVTEIRAGVQKVREHLDTCLAYLLQLKAVAEPPKPTPAQPIPARTNRNPSNN